LKDNEQKQVVAAARWGDGPYTRLIFRNHFPMLQIQDVPVLIDHFKALEA
jgi:hypothetical protein